MKALSLLKPSPTTSLYGLLALYTTDMAFYMAAVIRNTAARGRNMTKKLNYGLLRPGWTFFNLLYVVVSHRRVPLGLYDVNLTKHIS